MSEIKYSWPLNIEGPWGANPFAVENHRITIVCPLHMWISNHGSKIELIFEQHGFELHRFLKIIKTYVQESAVLLVQKTWFDKAFLKKKKYRKSLVEIKTAKIITIWSFYIIIIARISIIFRICLWCFRIEETRSR